MTMGVTMPIAVMHFAQRAQRDPAAETDKSDTGRRVDDIAEPCGEGDSGDPNNHADQQSRHDVANAGLERCACRLAPRPATLSRDQSNRHPVIGNNSVQDANRGDRTDQQQLWSITHQILFTFMLIVELPHLLAHRVPTTEHLLKDTW